MTDTDTIHGDILGLLDDAGAVEGETTHLTTREIAEALGEPQAAVEDALETLRFDRGEVSKGAKINDEQGSQWRLREDDALGHDVGGVDGAD